jgi:transcription initiation factor TFIIH subunit 3
MSHLPPPSIRNVLSVPTQDRIDFRAACFCHKDIIDIGFVCSVCLSSQSVSQLLACISSRPTPYAAVFCKPVPVCTTCRWVKIFPIMVQPLTFVRSKLSTKFPMKTLQRLNASRPPPSLAPVNGSGSASANGSGTGTPRSTGTPMATSLR